MSSLSGQDMTRGPLAKQILTFSLPLICSNLLQVLFNLADLAVVGQFVGATALGSVGSTTTLVTMFTGFLIGLGGGIKGRGAKGGRLVVPEHHHPHDQKGKRTHRTRCCDPDFFSACHGTPPCVSLSKKHRRTAVFFGKRQSRTPCLTVFEW